MAIKKTIKVGEKEYSVSELPEVLELIESVRKETKDKFHVEIEALKNRLGSIESGSKNEKNELEKISSEYSKLKETYSEAEAKLRDLSKEKEESEKKKTTSAEAKKETSETLETLKAIQDGFTKTFSELTKRLDTVEGNSKKMGVESYKSSLLQKYSGHLIPELLFGETLEELDRNLSHAIETSKKYLLVTDDKGNKKTYTELENERVQKEKAEKEKSAGNSVIINVADIEKLRYPEPPKTEAPKNMVENLKDMSNEDFEKNSAAIKKQLQEDMKKK